MGYGSYTAGDWGRLKRSRRIDTSTTEQIFTSSRCDPKFNPRLINCREARDSEDHPFSTPIVIGVDVTGSMGYLSTQIIKESLNELMQHLYSTSIITDPQLMFAAIGDVVDTAPLQVTQFESDIRIAEQLLKLWLENRGGDAAEDYELLWYFLDKHTDLDSFNRRNKKGFCFTIGDAPCHTTLSDTHIKKIFDDKITEFEISSRELALRASSKYELFHIMINSSAFEFDYILPGRVILIDKTDVKFLPDIILSTMRLVNGDRIKSILDSLSPHIRPIVQKSLSGLVIDRDGVIDL